MDVTVSIAKRNNVKITGNGTRPVLFAHGFGCDQNMWRFITPAFEKDYKIVLFDYVGCGKSDLEAYNEERYSTLNGYAEDIIEICNELDLKDVVFIGHSVSSMVGVIAYIQAPELFERLILVCPSPRYINDIGYVGGFEKKDLEDLLDVMDSNYIGWVSFLAPIVMKNPDVPELTEELQKSFCSIEPSITKKFAEVTFFSDNRNDLKKIKIPTLILQCSDDAIAPDEVGDFVHENISGSTLSKMHATGHCPHMSHPQETIDKMNEFLSN
jgi:sigma-B regulation protein RsbQ